MAQGSAEIPALHFSLLFFGLGFFVGLEVFYDGNRKAENRAVFSREISL